MKQAGTEDVGSWSSRGFVAGNRQWLSDMMHLLEALDTVVGLSWSSVHVGCLERPVSGRRPASVQLCLLLDLSKVHVCLVFLGIDAKYYHNCCHIECCNYYYCEIGVFASKQSLKGQLGAGDHEQKGRFLDIHVTDCGSKRAS